MLFSVKFNIKSFFGPSGQFEILAPGQEDEISEEVSWPDILISKDLECLAFHRSSLKRSGAIMCMDSVMHEFNVPQVSLGREVLCPASQFTLIPIILASF